tara:strand:- start:40615 stop:41523 length:909 start_codon:yes stop_codon:yes gene_type:complete
MNNKLSKVSIIFLGILFFLNIQSKELIQKEEETIFCFVGDTGEITEAQNTVASSLASSDCEIIWHTGDIIYPSGLESPDDPVFKTKFLIPFKETLNKGKVFYFTLGNHDYKKEPTSYLEIAKKNEGIHFPNNFYFEKFNDLCFVALDTSIFDKLRMWLKRGEQINWLNQIVDQNLKSCKFSIAVAHHPLFSSGDREYATPQLSFFLENYVFGVFDLYIVGHNHVLADEGDRQGTRQLISGSGSLPGGSPEETIPGIFNVETPGYLRLTYNPNKKEVFYKFIGSEREEVLWENSKSGIGFRAR